MMHILLEALIAFAVACTAVSYCALLGAAHYSRLEETEKFERWWQSWQKQQERAK